MARVTQGSPKSVLNDALIAAIEGGSTREVKISDPLYKAGLFEVRSYPRKRDGKTAIGLYVNGKAMMFPAMTPAQILLLGVRYPEEAKQILADFVSAKTQNGQETD